jgi:hypothetical protein
MVTTWHGDEPKSIVEAVNLMATINIFVTLILHPPLVLSPNPIALFFLAIPIVCTHQIHLIHPQPLQEAAHPAAMRFGIPDSDSEDDYVATVQEDEGFFSDDSEGFAPPDLTQ